MNLPQQNGARQADASLAILTLNTHKGLSPLNRRFVLPELRDAIRSTGADIVFLQEVLGQHRRHAMRFLKWPTNPHYEFLADSIWSQYAYGRNAVYPDGDHGNALLSKFPIELHQNMDVTIEPHEKRGILYCALRLVAQDRLLHVFCVHLGLRERHRNHQLTLLCQLLKEMPSRDPVIVAGDFNDWRQRANNTLIHCAGLQAALSDPAGRPPKTFPARYPILRLDRIYVRNLSIVRSSALSAKPWPHLSDHLPLTAEFDLRSPGEAQANQIPIWHGEHP